MSEEQTPPVVEPPKRQDWYFTFGHGQPHFGKYHVVRCSTEADARKEMFRRFGNKWSMMYESAEAAGVEQFGLTEIK